MEPQTTTTGQSLDDELDTKVRDYLDGLERQKLRVPGYRGEPNLRLVAEGAGVRFERLKNCSSARDLVRQRIPRLGLDGFSSSKYAVMKNRVTDYAADKRLKGGTIPSDPRVPGRASYVGVAAEMNIPYESWKGKGMQAFLERALRDLPRGPPYKYTTCEPGIDQRVVHAVKLAAFDEYLRVTYEETKTKIPESLNQPGLPNYDVIRAEHPVALIRLVKNGPFRQRLLESVELLGLEPRRKAAVPRITYREVIDAAVKQRLADTASTKTSEQAGRNLSHAGNRFMDAVSRCEADYCDADLTTDLDKNLDVLTAGFDNAGTVRKLRSEIHFLAAVHGKLLKALALPPTLADALRELCRRTGITHRFLERQLGLPRGIVDRWAYALNAPSAANSDIVAQIERYFDLPAATLTRMLPRPSGRRTKPTAGASLSKLYGSHVVRHLPRDFSERSAEEQAEIVKHVEETIMVQDSKFSRGVRKRANEQRAAGSYEYILAFDEWPASAKTEWKTIETFKTSLVTPFGKKRADGAKWDDDTAHLNLIQFERFFGYAILDPKHYGLGLRPEQATFALLTVPAVIHGYLDWQVDRRGGVYNTGDHKFLVSLAALVRAEFGVITQEVEWAGRLPGAYPGLEANASAAAAQSAAAAAAGWEAHCAGSEATTRALARSVEQVMVKTRDPFEPIMGLLQCQYPRDAYMDLVLAMDARCPDKVTSPAYHHAHVRDRVLMRINLLSTLRSKNMRQMTYKDDNTGQLKLVDGRWRLDIPRAEFKNHYSPYFGKGSNKRDYELVLVDEDGLYDLLQQYVRVSRPFLLHGTQTDILLVASGGQPFNGNGYHQAFRSITKKHFAWNPYAGTGMRGVQPHGPHNIRDVVATDVVKNTGRMDVAAWAIHDAELTVHLAYGRFLVGDKQRLLQDYYRDRRIPLQPRGASGGPAPSGDELAVLRMALERSEAENLTLRRRLEKASGPRLAA